MLSNIKQEIIVVGAGLSGSEVAWQLACANIKVTLYEMRPKNSSPAHKSAFFAEMVCSNSFRSGNLKTSAVGLMHEELRQLDSLIINTADSYKVPAGDALAVDRWGFAESITNSIKNHPNITVINEEFCDIKNHAKNKIIIIATGPLSSDKFNLELKELIGNDYFNFFDAIAPIVYKDSIDFSKAWFQSRYNKNDSNDYINCALNENEYDIFYNALINAEYCEFKDFEKSIPYFEGCLPIEELAHRGKQTLLFGPMKPVGLNNPHNKETPHGVVQLRQDNKIGSLYNMVGFQTKLTYSEQKRIFKLIPALKDAEFAKLGSIHKNTYINSPVLLNKNLSLKTNSNIFFAGQITGCEGYVESTAIGFICSLFVISKLKNIDLNIPSYTALNAILNHVTDNFKSSSYNPSNINFGLFEELSPILNNNGRKQKIKKDEKKQLIIKRALNNLPLLKTLKTSLVLN